MGDRLAAAAALVRRLDTAAEKLDSAWLARMLQTAIAKGAATLAREARRFRHRSGGRLVLSLYLLQDRQGGRLAILARLTSVLLFLTPRFVPGRQEPLIRASG